MSSPATPSTASARPRHLILGATSVAQVTENLGALKVDIDDAVSARLQELFPA